MSTQLAQRELAPPANCVAKDDALDAEYPTGVARGVINAVLIAIPFWALFGFVLYRLL
jgi:hypothetical protein